MNNNSKLISRMKYGEVSPMNLKAKSRKLDANEGK